MKKPNEYDTNFIMWCQMKMSCKEVEKINVLSLLSVLNYDVHVDECIEHKFPFENSLTSQSSGHCNLHPSIYDVIFKSCPFMLYGWIGLSFEGFIIICKYFHY